MVPLCLEEGIGLIPWSPLARGFLAGNRRSEDRGETLRARTDDFSHRLYYTDADFAIVGRVVDLAGARGVKPAQIALAWLLARPGISAPIVGASKPSHLEDAIGALDIRLSDVEARSLEELYQPHPVLGI
jgi:aryl-alcohol dehydrogenase (NADP+)